MQPPRQIDTDKVSLLTEHEKYVPLFGFSRFEDYSKPWEINHHFKTGADTLREEDRVDIAALFNSPNKIHDGKFLLCRVIVPFLVTPKVTTLVDDPEGKLAVKLILQIGSRLLQNMDRTIPVGTILAVRDPIFKLDVLIGYAVTYATNLLISDERTNKILPNVLFIADVPPQGRFQKYPLEILPQTLKEFKILGLKFLVEEKFENVVWCCTQGLKTYPDQIDLLSSRSQAYLNLKRYSLAKKDAELVLAHSPDCTFGIYRKAEAMCYVDSYDDALTFLDSKLSESTDKRNLILRGLKRRITSAHAKIRQYDLVAMVQSKDLYHDLPDFTGPVKIQNMNGRRPGLVATEQIEPGQLLIACKAFSITYFEEVQELLDVTICPERKDEIVLTGRKLSMDVAQRLLEEPEYEELIRNVWFWTDKHQHLADIDRVVLVSRLNCFYGKTRYSKQRYNGFWIWPSYINRTCVDANVERQVYGNMMFVRALKVIEAGEELKISLRFVPEDFEKRTKSNANRQVYCGCRLCILEEKEGCELRMEKKEFLKAVSLVELETSLVELEKSLVELEKMNSESILNYLNLVLLKRLTARECNYCKRMQFTKKCYQILKDFSAYEDAIPVLDYILKHMSSRLSADDHQEFQRLLKEYKELVKACYGTLEVVPVIGENLLKCFKKFGVQF